MKKNFIFILFLLLVLTPFDVDALSIDKSAIEGPTDVTIGSEHSFGVKINVDEVKKGSSGELGIWLVSYEVEYDPNDIIITGFSSRQWDSVLYQEDGKYYVLSEVNETNYERNKCIDEVLYCATYYVSIEYYVKNTDKTETTIKVSNIEVGLLPMIENGKEYTEDDVTIVSKEEPQLLKLNIQKNQNESPKEEPPTIVEDKKPTNDKEITNKTETTKSSNKYLKLFEIENYKIDFNKYKLDYEITVPEEINSLNIKVTTEDDKATYKIIGADNLKNNNNKVQIEVTAENKTKLTYNINVKKEEKKTETQIVETETKPKEKKEFKLEQEHIIILSIVGGIVLVIVIILFIISRIKDRKIDKALDEL